MFNQNLLQNFSSSPIIAVLVIEDPEDVHPLFEVLVSAGIHNFELTLRTSQALKCLKTACELFPQSNIGAGTVIQPDQVGQVQDTGAAFAVAPGCFETVLKRARELSLPFAPGIATPSDIERAHAYECNVLKYFPAEASGGINYLNAINGPYQHLNFQYIPLGGLNINNCKPYLNHPKVCAIGGSWIAPPKDIAEKNWSLIETRAREVLQLIQEVNK